MYRQLPKKKERNTNNNSTHRKRYSISPSSYTKLPFPTNRLLVGRHSHPSPWRGISTLTKSANAFAIPLLQLSSRHTCTRMKWRSYKVIHSWVASNPFLSGIEHESVEDSLNSATFAWRNTMTMSKKKRKERRVYILVCQGLQDLLLWESKRWNSDWDAAFYIRKGGIIIDICVSIRNIWL